MKSLKQTVRNTATTMVYGLIVLGLTTSPAMAQTRAAVQLQLVEETTGQIKVDIVAENVTDLYGAEIRLAFDPAVLAVQDADPDRADVQIQPGDLLPLAQGFPVANNVNTTEGTVTYAVTLLNPAVPVNGSGTLASLTLEILQPQSTEIRVEKAKLIAANLQEIPAETTSLSIAGPPAHNSDPAASTGLESANQVQPPQQIEFLRWGAIISLMVLAGLGSLVFFSVGLLNVVRTQHRRWLSGQTIDQPSIVPGATVLSPRPRRPDRPAEPRTVRSRPER